MTSRFRFHKPQNIGLAVRRFMVFAAPVIVLVVFVAANIVMGAFSPKTEETEEVIKATPVVVARAVARNVRLSVKAQGEATPRREISLAAEITGKIVYVSPEFIEGGAFEKDDILVRIDPATYEFRVVQAKANVAQARSRYASEAAEANIARKNWEELGDGEGSALALREPQMAEAAALLASAKAAFREAQLQLQRTAIRAPFKGRVRSKLVDIGEYVSPGISLGEVFSTNVMRIVLPLTDFELGQLGLQIGFAQSKAKAGPPVKLTALVAGQPRLWHGRIVRIDSGYDRQTRVVFAYAQVIDPYGANHDAPLASGLFVTAEIEGAEINNGIVVPRAALRGEDEVYIARNDNTLEIRKVIVASSDRTQAILIGNIQAGERVITSPVRGAAEGIEIAIAGDSATQDNPATVADVSN